MADDAIPPLRAHDYDRRDLKRAPKLTMAKATLRPKPPIGVPRTTPAPSPQHEAYCPWRDEADGIHQ